MHGAGLDKFTVGLLKLRLEQYMIQDKWWENGCSNLCKVSSGSIFRKVSLFFRTSNIWSHSAVHVTSSMSWLPPTTSLCCSMCRASSGS